MHGILVEQDVVDPVHLIVVLRQHGEAHQDVLGRILERARILAHLRTAMKL